MNRLPLFLRFHELVIGRDFVAGIVFDSRVLVEHDADSYWVFGVNPGALAESGDTLHGAIDAFRNRLKLYLIDVAASARDFQSLKSEVERFFYQSDDETLAQWNEARQAIRSGQGPEVAIDKERGERPAKVEIQNLKIHPKSNLVPATDGTSVAA